VATAAGTRGLRKGIRTLLQTIAGGGLTVLVTALAGGLDPGIQGIVMAGFTALVAYLQNYFETSGKIPTLLPTASIVPVVSDVGKAIEGAGPVVASSVATVDAVATEAGNIVGEVTDTAGDMVGEVTGAVDEVSDLLGNKDKES
jgi:hypothetical protein